MRRRFATLAAVSMFALALSASPALADTHGEGHGDGHNLTCTGGLIAPGTYNSITVTGFCTVDKGSITVRHDLVVRKGAALIALSGGSNVTVRHDLKVEKNGILAIGCVPTSFACLDDPNQAEPTMSAAGMVGHNLTADNALAVIVHNTSIGHNVDQHGGGGGLTCEPVLLGSPAYSTYEDSTIGGNVSITGLRTCWLGFLDNTVGHNVRFSNNVTVDLSQTSGLPDGNELAGNAIGGNLRCAKNDPAPQVGDSGLPLNVVHHHATGQCAGLKAGSESPRTRDLHVTKDCSAYSGLAGAYCTFTSSSLDAIKVGSKIFYSSPAGATSLDSDVVIDAGHGTTATGHCALDFASGLGKCTFWKGTGKLAGFHASVDVSSLGGPNWAWDGTYWFGHHHGHR